MGNDRASLTKQVKESNDIVDVVGGYVSLRPAGDKFKGLCPFHGDHNPSFLVDPRWQNYRCWSCGKSGDVYTFIQEIERIDFREALELLARRAGITLEKNADSAHHQTRAAMLDVARWSAEQYQQCLLDSPLAETARRYLGERRLSGESVRRFGLGFAPVAGDWLVQRAATAGKSTELLEKVGLIARRNEGNGFYDRFRDRVMFPIRDARGQTVGFGGRILPTSPLAARAPKYYNSADTPLFTKSEHLYGLDLARQTAEKAGYLAVVEGYTDVMMAHQAGVAQVVATMGTALNVRHVQHLRRFVPRVVLVFDADAGGNTGVDRALEIFVSQEVDLAIATLPEGLDPCDLLSQEGGAERFKEVLAKAVDALDFKLGQLLNDGAATSLEGRRRAVDAVLGIIALAPDMAGKNGQVKRELVVGRIAQRLALKEETVWARLSELRAARPASEAASKRASEEVTEEKREAPAAPRERQLLQVLLAEPGLVEKAATEIKLEEVQHPGLRRLLDGLYRLRAEGQIPDLDALRTRIIDVPRLAEAALGLQELGRLIPDRAECLRGLAASFRKQRDEPRKQELKNQLRAVNDDSTALELLRQLQNQSVGADP
ncbi:MAG: DNA primase [Gemmataceae bacterium]|nr:DNA primase [Gemmataceae bacterium]